jgi:hypothetical protein
MCHAFCDSVSGEAKGSGGAEGECWGVFCYLLVYIVGLYETARQQHAC